MLHNLKPSTVEAITKQNLLASMSPLPDDVPHIFNYMKISKRNEVQDRMLLNLLEKSKQKLSDCDLTKVLNECIEIFKRNK